MKNRTKNQSRRRRGNSGNASAYNVPALMPSKPLNIVCRIVFQLTATALGPFSFSPTPKDLADYTISQFISGVVSTTSVTAASGEILVTPSITTTPNFIKVRKVCCWGPTGGLSSVTHNIVTGDQLVIATPRKTDEAAGLSDKPFSVIDFPVNNKMAYSTSNAVAFSTARFSGYTAVDPTAIIDYHVSLFA